MTQWHGGKGDRPRTKSPDKWDKGWERIFNKAKKKVSNKTKQQEEKTNE